MPALLCFGFGYCAQHYVAEHAARFKCVVGTTRTAENACALASRLYGGRKVEMLAFDGVTASPELLAALEEAVALIVSAAPTERGDPVLAVLEDALIAAAPRLKSIVLLSTLSVYGDHAGGWVDETAPPHPALSRGDGRLEAERAWQALGARRGTPVAVLRLAGIYGPGQNALESLRAGTAKRILKPGQVFNRIHVFDIGQAIDAALARRAAGVFNVADDEPSPPGDPIVFAAELIGVAPPPEIPFEAAKATMSPMARGFYGECKRARNDKLKRELGVTLRYPTYREGLRALYAEMASEPSFRDAPKARAR
jgi:nucleoside-diphosphate-sugar epimerase